MLNRRQFLVEVSAAAALAKVAAAQGQRGPQFPQEPVALSHVKHVDIVHHTHTDVGYTALPSVVRDLQKRYIDIAVDACQADRNFRWTVEAIMEFDDWWRAATVARRNQFLALVKAGQIDVMGMPFNQTPFLNAMQWRQMFSWIPADLWRSLNIRAAMQNDVNGIQRAGAMLMLDHGIRHYMSGLNNDSGGPPFRRPDAFWWKLPDGRRLFVWLGEHYGTAQSYLAPARDGVRLSVEEKSVRAAHANFTRRVQLMEQNGYKFERLILDFTNPMAVDNGSPFPTLAPFIAAWNKLGLQPRLRLATASDAVIQMEKLVGAQIPVREGEWTDWWANGDASGVREVAASRLAKRYMAAAVSPVFGPLPASMKAASEDILKDLCLFDEHTWGAAASVSLPYSFNTLAQYVEKSDLAYRPMGMSEALLRRRVRNLVDPQPEGIYAINPAPAEFSGWASLAMGRGAGQPQATRTLVDTKTGEKLELQGPRFWLEKMAPNSVRSFRLETSTEQAAAASGGQKPEVKLDASGWPQSASWPAMSQPLFDGSLGDFICVGVVPPATRTTIQQLHYNPDGEKREAIRKTALRETAATFGAATSQETSHTLTFTQEIRHERLTAAQRTVELWKREPRARVSVRFDRVSSVAPEVLYLAFDLPKSMPLPVFGCGGVPFTPYRDQLGACCRDYFAIDGWAQYKTAGGSWLWVTRDAPLVAIGKPHVGELHEAAPAATHRLLAMVFDNCWHTNFVADEHGTMEFQFDLAWKQALAEPAELAEALTADVIVINSPAVHETAPELNNLYRR